ncbi:MAG: hypothetical protein R3C05_29965 [Pirellulaceae bacterium]
MRDVKYQSANLKLWGVCCCTMAAILISQTASAQRSQPIVPGTGKLVTVCGDDFEDPNWRYIPRNPKSTEDIDENQRGPTGKSVNGRWYEGVKRGHPDIVRRVPTPPGGLPGSEGALLLKSMFTGIPGQGSREPHNQDDFICNIQYRLNGRVPVDKQPNVVTRVWLPKVKDWERRSGPHFGFRLALETTAIKESESKFLLFKTTGPENEVYWPGMFVELQCKENTKQDYDYAYWRIRCNSRGQDFKGPAITQTGWWTLGMSCTLDGMVHYYISEGVDDLTQDDYVTSQFPYGYKTERLRSFFFNTMSRDDGHTWSTGVIVDDSKLFFASDR